MPFTGYIKGVNELYAKIGFAPYHWIKNLTVPWTPFTKKLSDCRVALVAAGGISLKSQEPYQLMSIHDISYREIPGDAKPEDIVINTVYFKHDDTDKDLNNLFPIEILREMERGGYIGDVSPLNFICGAGRIYEPELTTFTDEVIPEVVSKLKAAKVDIVLVCCGCPLEHQALCLVAREAEEEGLCTIVAGSAYDVMELVKPPRAIFTDFPLGHPFGRNNKGQHISIIKDAFRVLEQAQEPGTLVALPYYWGEPWEWVPGKVVADAGFEENYVPK